MTLNWKIFNRALAGIILLMSVFVFPWWLTFALALLFSFYFKFFIEAILSIFFLDLLYSPGALFLGSHYLTFFMILFFTATVFLKKNIINYA